MANEAIPVSHTLRRRLESLRHRRALAELSPSMPRLQPLRPPQEMAGGPCLIEPVGDIPADPYTPRMARPLTPAGMPAFLTGALTPRYPLLVDCRGLSLDAVRDLWQSWPESITTAEVSCVLIVDDPDCLLLAGDGACIELMPPVHPSPPPAEAFLARTRMDFVMAKYGVERIVKAEIYFGS